MYISLTTATLTSAALAKLQTTPMVLYSVPSLTTLAAAVMQDPRRGEWYQPNGALVQGTTSTTAFYRSRGANGEVSLNRPSGVESPTGQFCCEVPDATNTNQTLCVNIGILLHNIVCIASEDFFWYNIMYRW